MEDKNRQETLKIATELNVISKQLTVNMSELLNEVDAYTDHYYDQLFVPKQIFNDKEGIETRKEIKKGETYFDRVHESVMRNEFIIQLQDLVEQTMNKFQEKMNHLKDKILMDKELLVGINNEIIDALTMLEKKLLRKSLKNTEDENEKKDMSSSLNDRLNVVKCFKRSSLKDQKEQKHQEERYEQFKSILSIQQFRQIENWC